MTERLAVDWAEAVWYWWHEPSGYPCALWRNVQGALCGYVGVPPSHPLHGASHDAAGEYLEAHGGLTFADTFLHVRLSAPDEYRVPLWWFFGFDCGHFGDLSPAMDALLKADPLVSAMRDRMTTANEHAPAEFANRWRETYKTVEMVRAEVQELAEQAYAHRTLPVDARQVLARIVTGEAPK